jgi:hypothetical protein
MEHGYAESSNEGVPMARFLAGALACFLLMTGAFLLWQGRAERASDLPPPPAATAPPSFLASRPASKAPEASPKSKEERRFSRADKNKDGKIVLAELLEPRRKPFGKLDKNGDGRLSFEEWAHTTIDEFGGADSDHNRVLTPAEYATTAPKPPKKPRCSC